MGTSVYQGPGEYGGAVNREEWNQPPEPSTMNQPVEVRDETSDFEQFIVELTNDHRLEEGLDRLATEPRLIAAARQHSQEMCDLDYFSHQSPTSEFETLAMRGRAAGIKSYKALGENIASTTAPSPEAFVEMWMNSEGHRKNILRETFTHIGVGVYDCGSTTYATQVFGRF